MLPHAKHFAGNSGHRHNDAAVALNPPTGRGANRVGQDACRRDEGCLFDIARWHYNAPTVKELAQVCFEVWLHDHCFAEKTAYGLPRKVIFSRSDATGHHDEFRPVPRALEMLDNPTEVVS
jgi:hypothetical protein